VTDPVGNLHRAEATAAEARRRLDRTVSQLQSRLDPKVLAAEAKDRGTAVALAGADSAKRNPGVVAGAAGAILLVLVRGRIARALRRRRARKPVPAQARSHAQPQAKPPSEDMS
jgi:hypothetical protein